MTRRRLAGSEDQLAASALALVGEGDLVPAIDQLLEAAAAVLQVETIGRDVHGTIERAIGCRHLAALEDLLHRAVEALVLRATPILHALEAELRRALIDTRLAEVALAREIAERPRHRVCVRDLTGRLVGRRDDPEERREQAQRSPVGDLDVRVDVPPLGIGSRVRQIVLREVDPTGRWPPGNAWHSARQRTRTHVTFHQESATRPSITMYKPCAVSAVSIARQG